MEGADFTSTTCVHVDPVRAAGPFSCGWSKFGIGAFAKTGPNRKMSESHLRYLAEHEVTGLRPQRAMFRALFVWSRIVTANSLVQAYR